MANRTVEQKFRPVSVLNIFSKIYEKILKDQIIPYLDERFVAWNVSLLLTENHMARKTS